MTINPSSKSHAIVFTGRAELADAVRQELKALGLDSVLLPPTQDKAIEALITDAGAVLILDWELGSEVVNQVLGAIRGYFKVETRPILLVIPELEDSIIATATEYGVLQMHAGPVSRNSLRECLQALVLEDDVTRSIREVLVQVATARSKGDWAIATPLLLNLHEKLPDNARIIVELAENLIYEESWTDALALLQPLTQDETPVNIRALHLLGRCWMHQGDFDQAVGLLKRAKLINPHNIERLIDLGHAFIGTDQLEEARANFAEALALDEDNKEAAIGVGKVMLMSGEVNEALTLLKSVSGPREMASLFNTSAILTMRQGRFKEGMQLYRSALVALGRDDRLAARLLFNMGLGYKRANQMAKALTCFEKSLKLDSSYAKAAKHRDAILKAGVEAPAKVAGDEAGDAAGGGSHFAEEEFTGVKSPKTPVPGVGDGPELTADLDFEIE